jgi:protein SHQ1
LNLVSILFAYGYEMRSTMLDPTPESAWTISVLIPAFTALDTSPAAILDETLRSSYRRALAFPLYRSWAFCERVRLDVADILKNGVHSVLKCLLAVKSILDHHEVYYIYSKIWIDDYCVWAQKHIMYELLPRA